LISLWRYLSPAGEGTELGRAVQKVAAPSIVLSLKWKMRWAVCVCVIGVCVNIAICSRTKDAAESVRRARVRVRVRVCLYLLTYLYVTYTFDAVGAVTVVSAVTFISVSNLFFCP